MAGVEWSGSIGVAEKVGKGRGSHVGTCSRRVDTCRGSGISRGETGSCANEWLDKTEFDRSYQWREMGGGGRIGSPGRRHW